MPAAPTQVDAKAGVMLAMVELLRAGAVLTSREVAERFGVSQRTAQRYLLTVERWVPLDVRETRTWEHGHEVTYRLAGAEVGM